MDSFFLRALSTSAYSLPELIGCVAALALLWSRATPGPARKRGMLGVWIMLASVMLQLLAGLVQLGLIHNAAGASDLRAMLGALSAVRVLVNCVFVSGLLVLAWALCMALPAAPARRA